MSSGQLQSRQDEPVINNMSQHNAYNPNSSHNASNEDQRYSTCSIGKLRDGQFRRFEDSNLWPDDDTDQNSSTQCLIPPPPDDDHHATQRNYGSIQADDSEDASRSDIKICSSESSGTIEKLPFVMINVIVVLINAAGRFHNPLMNQYLYQRFADDVLGNVSGKTSSHPCLNDSSTDPTTATNVRKVQAMTSEMLLYLNLSNYCLGIPACLLLGAFTNSLSRKQLLAIPLFGYMIKCLTILIVVRWHLRVDWFYLGYAGEGILGNLCGFFFGAFLYTSDITSRGKARTMGVSILEGMEGLVVAGLNSVTGHLIEKTGFFIPALLSAGCIVISMVCVLFLPNRKPSPIYECLPNGTGYASLWYKRLATPINATNSSHVRRMVIIGGIAFLLALTANVGLSKIETLYIMNMPFCFSSVTVGWYMFGREMAYNGFLVFGVPLLYGCVPGMWLGILGSVSAILGNIMYAVATSRIEIYHIPALSIGQALPVNMIRGETSRLFGPEAQGPLFAIFATLECIGFAMGTSALSVYRASLNMYKGLTFILFTLVMVTVGVMLFIYQIFWKRYLLEKLVKELRQIAQAKSCT